MSAGLSAKRTFLVKERVAVMKLADTYDILDAEAGAPLAVAKEEPPTWALYLRLLVDKRFLPTAVNVREREDLPPVLRLSRGFTLLRSVVEISDAAGQKIGTLRSKVLSLGGAFTLLDALGQEAADIKGDWKGWNFTIKAPDGRELGVITKKWAGLGKEFFTSADNYVVSLHDGATPPLLALAAALAIDIVFKEAR